MKKLILLCLAALLLTGCVPVETTPAQSPPATPPMVFTHEPFDPGETENPRWYAETTLELIPRDDYGELYPYPGGWRFGNEGYTFLPCGFCTADGTIVCDPAFTDVRRYDYEGKTCYTFRRSFGYGQGNTLENVTYIAAGDGRFVLAFDEVRDAWEGTFAVRTGEKWGAVDYDGKEILPCVYEFPMYFGEGLAAVTRDFDKGYEYVDRQGKTVFKMPPPFTRAQLIGYGDFGIDMPYARFSESVTFREERAVFWTAEGYCGYIDRQGRVAIAARFGSADGGLFSAYSFYGGAALATEGRQQVVIDKDGAVHPTLTLENYYEVARPELPQAESFHEEGKWGYRDADGTVLLPPDYNKVIPMGGYYMVLKNQHCGLVDGSGEWVVKRFAPREKGGD